MDKSAKQQVRYEALSNVVVHLFLDPFHLLSLLEEIVALKVHFPS